MSTQYVLTMMTPTLLRDGWSRSKLEDDEAWQL